MTNKQTTRFEGDVYFATSLEPTVYGIGSVLFEGNLVVNGSATITGGVDAAHSSLTGLLSDDHTQYLLLAGRSGGQIATGGTASGNSLTFRSTTNATKGSVLFDETTVSTSSSTGSVRISGGIGISNTTDATSSINGGTFTTAGGIAIAKKAYIGTDLSIGGNITSGVWNGTTILVQYGGTGQATLNANSVLLGNGASGIQAPVNLTFATNTLTTPKLVSNDNSASTTSSTGAVLLSGGLSISNVTDATSSTNGGTFTTAGGLAVAKKAYIGTDLSIGGNLIVTGTAALPHANLTGLLNDDHTQYTLLIGRTGGQVLTGGIASGNSLTIRSTSNVTKGSVLFDETTVSTSSSTGSVRITGGIGISNTTDATSSTNGGTFTTAGGASIEKKLFVGTNLSVGGIVTSGIWNGTTIAVANGGTGVTTSTGAGSVVLSISPTLVTPILGIATGTSLSVTGNLNSLTQTITGSSSGVITITGQPASGTYNYNLPITAGTSGQVLTSQGGGSTAMTWSTPTSGTVTSVALSVPSFLSVSGSPVTSSGTITVSFSGSAIPVANGGTGTTTSTGSGNVVLSTSPTLTTPILGVATGTSLSVTGNVNSLTKTITGSSSGVITIQAQAAAGTYNYNLPITAGSAGQVLTSQGGAASAMTWTTLTTGTVTSVAMSVPSFLSVSGSPITSNGTLAVSLSGTALPVVNGGTGTTTSTGSGNVVLSTSPTLVTPVLGVATGTSLSVIGTTASTSNTTGVITSAGGIGISNVTDAASSTNGGSFTTGGGLAIAKKLFVGGQVSFLTTLDMNSTKILNLATPTLSTDAATKGYVDNAVQGIDTKMACNVATTTALTLVSDFENGDTIDGQVLITGDRVLIKNQANPVENGIYTVNVSGSPTRSTDFNTGANVAGAFAFIEKGTVNADTGYVCSSNSGSDVVGTNGLTFVQFSSAGVVDAGTGLTKTGNILSVNASQSQITAVGTLITGVWNATTIAVSNGGTGTTTSTGSGNVVLSTSPTLVTPVLGVATGTSLSVTGIVNSLSHTITGSSSGVITIQAQAAAGTYNYNLPITAGSAGQVLTSQGGVLSAMTWTTPTTGTVTSVALAVPSFLSVSGSPVTGSGTITVGLSGTALPVVNGGTGTTTSTGSGNVVLSTSPTLVTPVLGVATGTSLSVTGNVNGLTHTITGSSSGVITIQAQAVAGTYNYNLPITAGSAGQVLTSQGGVSSPMTWTTPTTGTVTSVALAVPSFLSVSGSPVTGSGTITVGLSGTALPVVNGGTGTTTSTGSGSVVLSTSPTLVTPVLGAASGTSLNVTGTTASTSNTTGVITSAGGIGISNVTDATSSTNGGTFTTAGGLAVAKKAFVGTDFSVGGNTIINGNLDVLGNFNLTGAFNLSHSSLLNLLADDHTQYVLLAGRSGGQVLTSGTGAGNNYTIRSTSNITKGSVLLDETTTSTSSISGCLRLAGGLGISNATDAVGITNGGTITTAGGASIAKRLFVGTTIDSGSITVTNSTQNTVNINCQNSTINPGKIVFTNSGGTGDFSIAGDGGDIYWQGGGGRSLAMAAYHEMRLLGGRGTTTQPTYVAGSGTAFNTIVQNLNDSVALRVQGSAGQLLNLSQWVSSAGTIYSFVDNIGNFTLPISNITNYIQMAGVSAPANPGGAQFRYYTDNSDGLFKSKSSSGVITIYQPNTTKGDLQSHNGTTNVRVPVSINGSKLIADSTSSSGLSWNSSSYAVIRDEKTTGTSAGTFTSGAWRIRTLNTSTFYPTAQTDISLTGNVITLEDGVYKLEAICPGNRCSRHTSRIVNNDTNAVLIIGTVVDSTTGQDLTTLSICKGILTVVGTLNIRVEHRCTTTRTTNGLGIASGFQTEVYTTVTIEKL